MRSRTTHTNRRLSRRRGGTHRLLGGLAPDRDRSSRRCRAAPRSARDTRRSDEREREPHDRSHCSHTHRRPVESDTGVGFFSIGRSHERGSMPVPTRVPGPGRRRHDRHRPAPGGGPRQRRDPAWGGITRTRSPS